MLSDECLQKTKFREYYNLIKDFGNKNNNYAGRCLQRRVRC